MRRTWEGFGRLLTIKNVGHIDTRYMRKCSNGVARASEHGGEYKKRILTKTLLMSGARCKKLAWYLIHQPEVGSRSLEFLKHLGNRVADHVREICEKNMFSPDDDQSGKEKPTAWRVRNLADIFEEQLTIRTTIDAVEDPSTLYILEGSFVHNRILIRADVMRRNASGDKWDLFEVKSATQFKDSHILDISIQKSIIEKSGVAKVDRCYIVHINNDFVLENGSYDGLLNFVDVTDRLLEDEDISSLVGKTLPLTADDAEMPFVELGPHCNKPYTCDFKGLCKHENVETPIDILPRFSQKKIQMLHKRGIFDLADVPVDEIRSVVGKRIWRCHRENKNWYSENLKETLESYKWPRYFMDFEMVQQGIPVIPGSRPREAHPFQWSVHRWDSFEQEVKLEDALSFVSFDDPDLRVKFLTALLDVLGEEGPIFVHSLAAEKSVLEDLKMRPDCAHLADRTSKVISRLEDTLKIAKNNFYSPKLRGAFGLKRIVGAIPTSVKYDLGGGLANGADAQLVWFEVTNPRVPQERKQELIESLVRYCASDTLAMVDFMHHLEMVSRGLVPDLAVLSPDDP